MSPWSAFRKGTARIWLHKRLILWLYLLNLAFAGVLVFPFRAIVGTISRTDVADDFVSGFPLDSMLEFWSKHSLELKSLAFAALGLGILYLILNVFLSGGIVAALNVERRVSLRRFLNDASRYFGRFFRLFIILAIVVGLVAFGYSTWVSDYVDDLRENATTDRASFLWRCLVLFIALVFLAFTIMVFDYARIRTVVERRRSMFFAALFALGFSLRRLWRTVPLFFLNLLIVGALCAVYLFVEDRFSNATPASTIGLFVVQQLFILSRIWMRLSFYSTQLAYYRSLGEPMPSAVQVIGSDSS